MFFVYTIRNRLLPVPCIQKCLTTKEVGNGKRKDWFRIIHKQKKHLNKRWRARAMLPAPLSNAVNVRTSTVLLIQFENTCLLVWMRPCVVYPCNKRHHFAVLFEFGVPSWIGWRLPPSTDRRLVLYETLRSPRSFLAFCTFLWNIYRNVIIWRPYSCHLNEIWEARLRINQFTVSLLKDGPTISVNTWLHHVVHKPGWPDY